MLKQGFHVAVVAYIQSYTPSCGACIVNVCHLDKMLCGCHSFLFAVENRMVLYYSEISLILKVFVAIQEAIIHFNMIMTF